MESTSQRRIAVISESSLEQVNGVSGSVKRFLGHIALHGHDARVVTPKPTPHRSAYEGFPVAGSDRIRLQGFDIATPPSKRWVQRKVASCEPDIIQLHSPLTRLSNGAIQFANKHDIPTIAIYQTDVAQYARRFSSEAIGKMLFKQSGWLHTIATDASEQIIADRTALLHNQATMTLSPSTAATERLLQFGVNPDYIRQWGRGVDTKLFRADRKLDEDVIKQKRAWSQNGRKIVVGYVGRLAPEKQVERLEALSHDAIQLVVVGSGPSQDKLKKDSSVENSFYRKVDGRVASECLRFF